MSGFFFLIMELVIFSLRHSQYINETSTLCFLAMLTTAHGPDSIMERVLMKFQR